jgi:hypothetical protein
MDEFFVDPKSAVKKLTAKITEELIKVTVNAPDWLVLLLVDPVNGSLTIFSTCRDSRHAATMARKILWPDDRKLPLIHLRHIDQRYAFVLSQNRKAAIELTLVLLCTA